MGRTTQKDAGAAPAARQAPAQTGGKKKEKMTRSRYTAMRKMTSTIRKFQSGKHATQLLMQRAPFQRMVKEARTIHDLRFQKDAIDALQEGAEAFLLEYLEGGNVAAVHRRAVTTMSKDIELVQTFKNENIHIRSYKKNEKADMEAAQRKAEATAKAYNEKKKKERVKPPRVGA